MVDETVAIAPIDPNFLEAGSRPAQAMDRKRIGHFVREDHPGHRLTVISRHDGSEPSLLHRCQRFRQAVRVYLVEAIAQDSTKLRPGVDHANDGVVGETADARPVFDDRERLRKAHPLPPPGKMPPDREAEERVQFRRGQEIAGTARSPLRGSIVAIFEMIERQLHVPGERDRPGCGDLLADDVSQRCGSGDHERPPCPGVYLSTTGFDRQRRRCAVWV